ncbi:MAG: TusE/DsrC/DsvC family sulfur relay protein [Thermacetogeniaceae bacterium]
MTKKYKGMLMKNSNQPIGTLNKHQKIAGRDVLFDEEGFLWYPEDWCENVAETLAYKSGLKKLTDDHWKIIYFMRDFYFKNGRAPLNKQLVAGTGMSMLTIEALFPGGIKHGARRIAGIPNPKACL